MGTRLLKLTCLIFFSTLLSGCSLNFFGQKSGLDIVSHPQAEVLLDGQSLGKTPIIQSVGKTGTFTLRLNPTDSGLNPWETKITLTKGYYTAVNYQFGKTPDQSSSHILTYEKLSDKNKNEIAIVSNPSNVSVSVDDNPVGFSSQPLTSITAGSHKFTFSTPGFQDKTFNAKVIDGQRLVINLQMATQTIIPTPTPTPLATPSATPTPTPTPSTTKAVTPLPKQATTSSTLAKPYVEILTTPTGWLKVRADASVSSEELAKVNPGDSFPYRESTVTGWYEIQYVTGKWGFVSSQYAKLVK